MTASLNHPSSLPTPSPEQQRILERIHGQREAVRQRRAAVRIRVRAASAQQAAGPRVNPQAPLPQRVLEFARLHPIVVSLLAATAAVAGPARVMRWVALATPVVTGLLRRR